MSDSSDGETTKGWAIVDQAGQLEDSDDGGSISSCDVALDQDVVHFRHVPRRSSSVISDSISATTPTNVPLGVPAFDHEFPSVPANFRAQQEERESLASSSMHENAACAQNDASPVPANRLPQGARPKTTNQHPANYVSHDQCLDQSSSSNNSTITGDTKCNDLIQENGDSSNPNEDYEEDDESLVEDTLTAASDEKVDTASMSSIEILNVSADDWQSDGMGQEAGAALQPVLSTSALSIKRDDVNQAASPGRSSSSDTDSEFVRVDQHMDQDLADQAIAAAALQETASAAPQDNISQNIDYSAGAAALPLIGDQWNDSIHSNSSHSGSSFSMCDDALFPRRSQSVQDLDEPRLLPRRSQSVQDMDHPINPHLPEESEGEEQEDQEEPLLAPSQRFQGDLDRQYFARRLRRDMSASVSSSASDLSSFSFLGLRAGRQRMNRQNSDDMSEMSSVFTDGSEDLPANMMIGTTKPGPKQYRHTRAERLNSRLNYLLLLVIAFVITLGIGHYVGSYQEKYYKHQIRQGQVKRLRELQDDLITCLDQRTTETDDKKTFADMVKSLLGDNVKDDTMDSTENTGTGGEVKDDEEEDIDCDNCKEGKSKHSEMCNTLCVQGGIWAELDEAISELPMDSRKVDAEDTGQDNGISDADSGIDLKEAENSGDERTSDNTCTQTPEEIPAPHEEIPASHEEIPAENTNKKSNQDVNAESNKGLKQDEEIVSEEQTYSYEEAMDIKNKFEKKQDSLEEEEPGFIAEKVITMPDRGEDIVTVKVLRKQDNLIEEEPGFITEKVIVMPQEDISGNDDEGGHVFIKTEVKEMPEEENYPTDNLNENEGAQVSIETEEVEKVPQEIDSPTVKENVNEDDDTWVSIETEDEENDEVIISKPDATEDDENEDITRPDANDSETVLEDVKEGRSDANDSEILEDVKEGRSDANNFETVLEDVKEGSSDANDSETVLEDVKEGSSEDVKEDEIIDVDDVRDLQTDKVTDSQIKELQDQLILAQNRADMWQRKYVEEHHHKPEVIVVEKVEESNQEVELEGEIERLKQQLNLAAAHADIWQTLYHEKSSAKHQENASQEEAKKENENKEKESDTCGPLGCFAVFENILADFLNSTEGQEFLKFANLTQVLNNATFWEDFAAATNISAYTISDAVYERWIEFQDYVKTAGDHDFIINFKAVIARAGQSVASAFGSFKNYSSTMGGKAQNAWESVRNFTADTIDQHNIHLNNISQLKEKVAAAWDTVRNMSSKAVNNGTKKKMSHVIDQAHENLKKFGKSVQDNMKDIGKTVKENVDDFGKTVKENMQDLRETFHENMQDLGKSVHGTWTSVKDTFGKWHRGRKEFKKHKKNRGGHGKWDHFETSDSASEEEIHEQHTRKQAHKDSNEDNEWNRVRMRQRNKGGNGPGKCKGKKCKSNKNNKEDQTFGPLNKGEKRNGHHRRDHKRHGKDERNGYDHEKQKYHQEKKNMKIGESDADFWDVDWDDVLDVFNMNCYGESECLNHQRRDGAKLYDELTEYKKWLKAHQRKREMKQVRKFLDSLGKFLKDPDLDDGDLEDLKEDFGDVLEKVGRFVQDQRDRNNEQQDSSYDTEYNSTVIVDFDKVNAEHDNKDDADKRKFAGYGYQSDGDEDNWFLRRGKDREDHYGYQSDDDEGYQSDGDEENWFLQRAKDREDHYQDKWADGKDGSWYQQRMQARSDSRTGVTMWDMYQWIRDKFDHRETIRQFDEINWFLKRP